VIIYHNSLRVAFAGKSSKAPIPKEKLRVIMRSNVIGPSLVEKAQEEGQKGPLKGDFAE